jgi:prepilin-type N-terminal cleavage/methylation domain-containing protein
MPEATLLARQYIANARRSRGSERAEHGTIPPLTLGMNMIPTSNTRRRTSGFTLVELLVVIAIISIIAGIAIPSVMTALKTGKTAAMKAELESLNQGIESYKTKYGDYPPDFSSWSVVQRHYRKIFPDINTTELTLLYALCDNAVDNSAAQTDSTADGFPGSVMDRAEALVWALGGFSSDPQRPFTGTGGPLVAMVASPGTNPANYQYNTERDNRFVEFDVSRLSIVPFDPAAGALSFSNRTRSGDEPPASFGLSGAQFVQDLFPAYSLSSDSSPATYFDARTYGFVDTSSNPASTAFNGYARLVDNANDVDGVRPLYSEIPSTTLPSGSYGSMPAAVRAWKFVNPQTFQLLAPGLDRRYGAITDVDGGNPSDAAPVYFQYKSGALLWANASASNPQQLFVQNVKRFDLTAAPAAIRQRENVFLDNMANFTTKTFGDEIP